MNKRTYLLTFVVAASFLLSIPASADTLYDNGPINGQTGIGSWSISYGNIMSDSFTLTGTSTLNGVNLGLWISQGDIPTSLEWRINLVVPDPALGPIGTTAPLTNTFWGTGTSDSSGSDVSYDIYASSFSLPTLELDAGTYYLTLDFGQTNAGGSLYWDINNGPSVAFRNGANVNNYLDNNPGSNSDSFKILGSGPTTPPTVPEGGASLVQLGIGLAGLAGFTRRRLNA